jgi:hypothetical protein
MTTYEEFEKEFPHLNHARLPCGAYKNKNTREWCIYFSMYKMQEDEIAALKAEVANLKALTDLQANSIDWLCNGS